MRNTIDMTKTIHGRSVNWRVLIVLVAVAGATAALLASGFRGRTAQAAAAAQATPTPTPGATPNYGKVKDFLNGRTSLLRNDDFVIGYSATLTDATDLRSSLLSATTDNSVPTLRDNGDFNRLPTAHPTEFVAGRFFRTGYDVTLQFLVETSTNPSYILRGSISGSDSRLQNLF